jgi:DNA-directed RNA polymerase subunit RPC12/RpoP
MEQATKPAVREAELTEVFWAAALAFCEDHGIHTGLRIHPDAPTRIDSHNTSLRVGVRGKTMYEKFESLLQLKNVCESVFDHDMSAACEAIEMVLKQEYVCGGCGYEFYYFNSAAVENTISCPLCKNGAIQYMRCNKCKTKLMESELDNNGDCAHCQKGESDEG